MDINGPVSTPIFTHPDDVGVESVCETLQPCINIELIRTVHYDEGSIVGDGEPSCISLITIESTKYVDAQRSVDKHYRNAEEHKLQICDNRVGDHICVPAPNTLYLGRSTGSIYRFEI